MDGWNTIVSSWDGFLADAMLVHQSVFPHPQLPWIHHMTFETGNSIFMPSIRKFKNSHSHDFTLKFLGHWSYSLNPISRLKYDINCCRFLGMMYKKKLKLNELIPQNFLKHFLQPEIYAFSKKQHHSWYLFVQKFGGLYVLWKFNIAIGPPEKWIELEVGRRLLNTLSVLGARVLFLP